MAHHPKRIRNTPERNVHHPTIRQPADVYFNPAWAIVALFGALMGAHWLRNHRWLHLFICAMVGKRVWQYVRHHEPQQPALQHVSICDRRIPPGFHGFRIGQISDIHLGQPFSHENLRWAIQQMQQHNPDLIVLTGDLVNDRESITDLPYYLRQLRAPYGVYAIPGNHDYVEEIDDVIHATSFAGIPMIRNQGFMLNLHGDSLYVAGVDDIWHGQMRLDRAMASNTTQLPTILLAHSPDCVREALDYPHIVLQLSGHVHGGHMRLPLLGLLARPRFGRLYTHATQRVHHVWLHISLGLSGRQLRLGNPPEATIFTLLHDQGDT